MRIALAQINYHIGNFAGNLTKMLAAVEQAKEQKADIVCFAELATCGYPPRDFLLFSDFARLAKECIEKLAEAAQGIAIVVGSPAINPKIEGKDLHNAAFFLADGKILHQQNKTLLPTYDIFDEDRYFEPATEWNIVVYKGYKIALTICEDIWNIANENPLYTICPLDELINQKPDFILNISASPFAYDHDDERKVVVKANAKQYQLPLFYVNQVGAQTEILFDGGSLVVAPNGKIVEELPYFEECVKSFDLSDILVADEENDLHGSDIELIHDGLIAGLQNYFSKLGFSKAVLGLSGGIDSAVTAAIAYRALGAENVRAVLMPSKYSSDHSIADAKKLAENFGMPYDLIPIHKAYDSFESVLSTVFEGTEAGLAEENIQARARGVILMAISNKFGNILLNTSNKSEAAVGYGTLYGDMCGGLSVLGDVYKTQVYQLARYINKDQEWIPENSIVKAPSAELRPNQKDSDSLPDYDVLDKILYQYIEMNQGPQEIISLGFDEKLVRRILRLVNINEFKRYQMPPVLRVSRKAFGMGRRMPIVGKYLS